MPPNAFPFFAHCHDLAETIQSFYHVEFVSRASQNIIGLAVLLPLLLCPPRGFCVRRHSALRICDYARLSPSSPGSQQRVTVPNTFGVSVSDVVFNIPAAHKPGVFTLRSVKVDDVSVDYQRSGTILRVQLPRPLPADESVTLDLDFVVRVPELINPQSFAEANLAYTSDALMAGYWYPYWPLSIGCGWLKRRGIPSAIALSAIADTPHHHGHARRNDRVRRRSRAIEPCGVTSHRRAPSASPPPLSNVVIHQRRNLRIPSGASFLLAPITANVDQSRALVCGTVRTVSYRSLRVAEFSGPGAWNSQDSSYWAQPSSTITMERIATV
jgi:hypothetical protein